MTTPPVPPSFLDLRVVRDAVLVARPVLDDWSGGAGVLRRDADTLRYVRGSGIRRVGREQIVPPEPPSGPVADRVDAAIYGGFLYDHYGHFLLESLARLWAPDAEPSVPVVWIAAWTESFAPWMVDVLDVLGVAADRRIVTAGSGPLEVGELLVADPGFEFGRWMHHWFGRRLGRWPSPAVRHGEHVWLSRSSRAPISGLDEEPELEDRLRSRGWSVVRPEDLSVRDQLALLAGASHVAGIEGSAFHTLALLREVLAAVDLFTRQEHANFELVAQASGFEQARHRFPGATSRERKKVRGTDVQWSGADVEATLALLADSCRRHGHEPPG